MTRKNPDLQLGIEFTQMDDGKLLNRDGTITIQGTAYDFPTRDGLSKWDYRVNGKEIEVWISAYVYEGAVIFRFQSCLKMGVRGKLELDGKPLKGKDKEKAELIFGNIAKTA